MTHDTLAQAGRDAAAALYALVFAPLGAQAGVIGGVVADAAARSCAADAHDALAARFNELLAAQERPA